MADDKLPASRKRRQGFTLIEAMITMIIVSTGVLSILAAQQAYHRQNNWSQRVGTALLLANELRELTLTMPLADPITGVDTVGPELGENSVVDFDDLDDFADGVDGNGFANPRTFSPPINAQRQEIPNMAGWSQVVDVASVNIDDITADPPQVLGTTVLMRVNVIVLFQGPQDASATTVTQLTWVVGE